MQVNDEDDDDEKEEVDKEADAAAAINQRLNGLLNECIILLRSVLTTCLLFGN